MKAVIFGTDNQDFEKYSNDCINICKLLIDNNYNIYTNNNIGLSYFINETCFNIDKNKLFVITTNNNMLTDNILEDNITLNKSNFHKKILKDCEILIFFPLSINILQNFFYIINLLYNNKININNVILYDYKYWESLLSWLSFNNIKIYQNLIVIDSFEELKKKNLFNNKIIINNNNYNNLDNNVKNVDEKLENNIKNLIHLLLDNDNDNINLTNDLIIKIDLNENDINGNSDNDSDME